jgi:hypothetical protein
MDATAMRANLVASGIAPSLADAMINQAQKLTDREAKSKEPKAKKGGWHPGMVSASAKVDTDVEVTVVCCTCGDKTVETRVLKIAKDSPTKQKVAVSICNNCPTYFRALDYETLVSLVLIKEHPAMHVEQQSTHQQVRMAKHMTPEEVVTFKPAK